MLLGKNFDDIDDGTLQALIDAGATETVHLDFKRETYGTADADKKEFLKDISAFANSFGGHLLIGIDEADGAASAITPLRGIDVDQELLRLENIAQTGVDPKIYGLRMKRIQIGDGDVIAIHVPRSVNPPHRVIFKNTNRYHARNSSGTYELALEELRMLFGQQRTIEERSRAFTGERFLQIQANEGPLPLPIQNGGLVMHLIPLADLGGERRHQVAVLQEQRSAFCPIGASGHSGRINLDGFVVYRGGDVCHGYTQIFRNGCVEATSASIFRDDEHGRHFASLSLPENLIQFMTSYMKGLRAIGALPPIMLQISFFGTAGLRMGVDPMRVPDQPPAYSKESLHLPPSIIEDFRDDDDYVDVIAEQMHFMWNAFDFGRCFYFDDENKWKGR